jgi:hypothetical protein
MLVTGVLLSNAPAAACRAQDTPERAESGPIQEPTCLDLARSARLLALSCPDPRILRQRSLGAPLLPGTGQIYAVEPTPLRRRHKANA